MVRDARCGSVTAPAGRSIKRCAHPTRLGDHRAERAIRQDGLGCRAAPADRSERSRQRRRLRAFVGGVKQGQSPVPKRFGQLLLIVPGQPARWFMERFIDAYDWVMVPNVYGMSQHADGGLITTKPYLSGSSCVRKMSNFRKGPWCPIWDALYWRFIDRHREFFAGNPRMSAMVAQCDRMGAASTSTCGQPNSF